MVETGYKFSGKVAEDAAAMEELFENCADIKKKEMRIGSKKEITCFLMYIEITMSSVMFRHWEIFWRGCHRCRRMRFIVCCRTMEWDFPM